ncbi:MAG TPA: Gfo/Idh/MocA family oxidoreductase [Devosiaceae bacterium]|jgi:predicted dehydrogenase|nr:Gfo/Idh/MocA family oxidoreductase [Devosiaceae bacterium]
MSINVAVIGAGFMGALWARALHEHLGATVGVIGDVDAGRGQALAEKFGARHIGDAADAATAPGVDAVVVCTPEHLHLEPTAAAIGAGRPTAVEKPTAHTVETADEIARLAKLSGVPVLAGHVLRFEPRYAAMKAAVADGTIGSVLSIRNERIGLQADRARLADRTTVALYYGVHEFDIARWLGGDIAAVHGEGTPDMLSGAVRFASGAHGTIQVGWCLPDRTPGYGMSSVTVIGENGVLKVTQGENGIIVVGPDGMMDADVTYAPEVNGRLGGMLAREVDHFVAVATGREDPLCTAEDGAAAVRASLALEASAREGRSLSL